ncbi:MAG: preprotein translocase subunit SecE [Dethiobacteria bacterium]|nr:preprotein translocase subunit SecE [Bacillota bacterium]
MRFFKRIGKFLHEVRGELKKVNWPNKREFTVFTGIVLSTVLVIGVFFWLLDTTFLAILQLVIR